MKDLIAHKIPLTWLLLFAVGVGAVGVGWIAVSREAAPPNAVLIEPPARTQAAASGHSEQPTAEAQPSVTVAPALTNASETGTSGARTGESGANGIVVFVTGAVQSPGVYNLPQGSRVADAVRAAGGLLPDANLDATNLAARVSDEEHVSVPRKGDPASTAPSSTRVAASQPAAQKGSTTPSPPTPVNINTASQEQLEAVPGIGPVTAGRIIAYRSEHGAFKSIDAITNVPGIKEGTLAKLRPYITVGK